MKRIFVIIITTLFLIVFGLIIWQVLSKKTTIIIPTETPKNNGVKNGENISITPSLQGYKTVWITVNDPNKLILYSNLDNKLSSHELATKYSCAQLISGGFYDKKGNHIGLFVSEGETISESKENITFNGYFNISKTGVLSITEYPIFSPRISLQSGPFLFKSGKKVNINLDNDENARRMAVGVTEDNLIIFFTFYEQSNNFSGPELTELPEIIEQINGEKKLRLKNVINLDGGAHSAYISDLITLREASTIGSFFCIKP